SPIRPGAVAGPPSHRRRRERPAEPLVQWAAALGHAGGGGAMSYTETELTARYRAVGSGWHAAVRAELEEIVAHADAGGHHRLAFRARRDLANRHCVSGQWDRGFPLFARCLSDYDSRPDDYGPQEEWSLRSW